MVASHLNMKDKEKRSYSRRIDSPLPPSSSLMRKLFPQQTAPIRAHSKSDPPLPKEDGIKRKEKAEQVVNSGKPVHVVHSMKDWLGDGNQGDTTTAKQPETSSPFTFRRRLVRGNSAVENSQSSAARVENSKGDSSSTFRSSKLPPRPSTSARETNNDPILLRDWETENNSLDHTKPSSTSEQWVDSKLSAKYLNNLDDNNDTLTSATAQKLSEMLAESQINSSKQDSSQPMPAPSSRNYNPFGILGQGIVSRKTSSVKGVSESPIASRNPFVKSFSLDSKNDAFRKQELAQKVVDERRSSDSSTISSSSEVTISEKPKSKRSNLERNSKYDALNLPHSVQAAVDLFIVNAISQEDLEEVIVADLRFRRGEDNQSEDMEHISLQANALYKNGLISQDEYLDLLLGHYTYHSAEEEKLTRADTMALKQKVVELTTNIAHIKAHQEVMRLEFQEIKEKYSKLEQQVADYRKENSELKERLVATEKKSENVSKGSSFLNTLRK